MKLRGYYAWVMVLGALSGCAHQVVPKKSYEAVEDAKVPVGHSAGAYTETPRPEPAKAPVEAEVFRDDVSMEAYDAPKEAYKAEAPASKSRARSSFRSGRGSKKRPPSMPSFTPSRSVPQAPAIKAGRHDDNKQYNRFLSFLEKNKQHAVFPSPSTSAWG